jgi:nitrite reductase/ring-hydroxylating ferredoxin subunit
VRCPWHKWEFEIATSRALADAKLRVRRYAVHLDGDEVVVTMDHP